MLVMTYSDARQNFASVLDKSEADGAVLVKRADGSLFRISPEQKGQSPFLNDRYGVPTHAGLLPFVHN